MEKDWKGNSTSVFACLAATNHGLNERETNDFYATDPIAISDLLNNEKFNDRIWECACGQGHLAKPLIERGYTVKCTDLIERGFGKGGVDFLQANEMFEGDIITNPPYKYCDEFILKALDLIPEGNKVAMFLRLQTLEGQRRYKEVYQKYPPKTVYVYSKRIKCAKNAEFDSYASAVCFAWFVWVKGFTGVTELKWIAGG